MKRLILILTVVIGCLFSEKAAAATDTLRVEGAKGKLAALLEIPEGVDIRRSKKKLPVVIILHGLTGNMNEELEIRLAESLAKEGVASLRFDFNGHGHSEGSFNDMTISNELEDARRVYRYVASLPWVKDISLWGHSQGGVVSAMLAGELGKSKIKRVVLVAPAGLIRDDAIRGNFFGYRFDPSNPPDTLKFWKGLPLGKEYLKDAARQPIYETAARYKGPVCIIHGTGDRGVPFTSGLHFKQVMPRSEIHLIEGEGHVFSRKVKEVTAIATSFLTGRKYPVMHFICQNSSE